MHSSRIEPREAIAGFAALAVILTGEVLVILQTITAHPVPLSPFAQLVSRIFFGH